MTYSLYSYILKIYIQVEKGLIKMSEKTTYIIKDIDKNVWVKFRGKAMLNGYKTASDCLNYLINRYVNGKSK